MLNVYADNTVHGVVAAVGRDSEVAGAVVVHVFRQFKNRPHPSFLEKAALVRRRLLLIKRTPILGGRVALDALQGIGVKFQAKELPRRVRQP